MQYLRGSTESFEYGTVQRELHDQACTSGTTVSFGSDNPFVLQAVNALVEEGSISEDAASSLKKHYETIHSELLRAMASEKRHLDDAKSLKQLLDEEKRKAAEPSDQDTDIKAAMQVRMLPCTAAARNGASPGARLAASHHMVLQVSAVPFCGNKPAPQSAPPVTRRE